MECKFCGAGGIPEGAPFCCWCGKRISRKRKKKTEVTVPKARQLASGGWYIQMNLGGENVYVTEKTEDRCTAEATRIKAEYKAGKREAKPQEPKFPTLGKVLDQYIAVKELTCSPSTIRGYMIIRRNRFQDYMNTPVDQIDYCDMLKQEKDIEWSDGEQISLKTVKNAWGLVKSALKMCKAPIPDIDAIKVPENEMSFLDEDEIKTFLKLIKGEHCELAALLALHSLRRSELFALEWRNVDFKHSAIIVHGAVVPDKDNHNVDRDLNKTEKSTRIVPIMIPRLKELLEERRESSGKVIDYDNIGKPTAEIQKICEAAGFEGIGLHALRRSFASLGYHLKMDERTIMLRGGWSSIETVHKIYIKLSQKHVDTETQKMIDFYAEDAKADKKETGETV